MLKKKQKDTLIKKVQTHEKDTGSPEVQIALLTKQIDSLANHLKTHRKDNHSRKGLLQMVDDRRAHIKYLKRKDEKRYGDVAKKLGLKG
ncbi:MAG: 30S ribosomal protein S15 [Parcubacteria group bacterium]|nr:30S ribosomal protein S15 [Parcubacteria group bacterium]